MSTQQASINRLIKKIENLVGGVSDREAVEKVKKWQAIVELELRDTMREKGYMPKEPIYYKRTGEYPTHTQRGYAFSRNGTAEGTVGYAPYYGVSLYSRPPQRVELTGLLESGYQVRKPARYYTGFGRAFDFRHKLYFGYRPGVPVRAMVIAALAGQAAADGVTLTLG